MTTPRRRILRPHPSALSADTRQQARLQKKLERLAKDRVSLKRWLTRLKRATNTVAELHQRISRLETLIAS